MLIRTYNFFDDSAQMYIKQYLRKKLRQLTEA